MLTVRLRIFFVICLFSLLAPLTALGDVPLLKTKPLENSQQGWEYSWRLLSHELIANEIGTLAKATLKAPAPKNSEEWFRRFQILYRADYHQDVMKMLVKRPSFLTKDKDWGIGSTLEVWRINALDTAVWLRLCELFPEQPIYDNLSEVWKAASKFNPGLKIDEWLAKRAHDCPSVWFGIRLRYRSTLGTENELLDPLEAQVRAHPESYNAAENYALSVINHVGVVKRDIGWLGSFCKPKLAIEAYSLVSLLQTPSVLSSGQPRFRPSIKTTLLEYALIAPVTPEDVRWYDEYSVRNPSSYASKSSKGSRLLLAAGWFHESIQRMLLQEYTESGETEKAKKMLDLVNRASPPGPVPGIPGGVLARQAGELEANRMEHTIENRIKSAENGQKESQYYWQSRGNYYLGRKEYAEGKKDFDRALELAPLEKDGINGRVAILYDYHWLLVNSTNGLKAANQLYRDELGKIPLDSSTARLIMYDLCMNDFPRGKEEGFIRGSDPIYYRFLDASLNWNEGNDYLCLCLLTHSKKGEERDGVIAKLEELAHKSPQTRAETLGLSFYNIKDQNRAKLWLEESLRGVKTADASYNAKTRLWDIYIQSNDWRNAEAMLTKLFEDRREFWDYNALTFAAARAGGKADAMRFYRLAINRDRRLVEEIPALSELGLKKELKAYYTKISSEEPKSFALQRIRNSPSASILLD